MHKFVTGTLALFILSVATPSVAQDVDKALEGVGDVVYSILSQDLFNATHSGQWVLLDGRAFDAEWPLTKFMNANSGFDLLEPSATGPALLPDARGVFVRGININRDAESGDPAPNRRVGSYQSDAFKMHMHDGTYNGNAHRSGRDTDNKTMTHMSPSDGNRDRGIIKFKTLDAGTEPETRPRNITLYTYVKVSG